MKRKRGKGRSDRGNGAYAVGGEVYVTEIEDGDEGCRIRWAIRKTYLNPVDPAPVLMQLAESVRSVCQTYGLTQYTVGVTCKGRMLLVCEVFPRAAGKRAFSSGAVGFGA